ncbi:hypothetical protein EVAR_83165_1 [Eumeta japonica]|uniref:Uncharacterized protein n=1 Tax=Eumeta variegata TaxID=151549 RepID=A0A4C1YE93_EUMVA|nr:hypothetical protein EVAR_83165_1 [Eumeta japonica]
MIFNTGYLSPHEDVDTRETFPKHFAARVPMSLAWATKLRLLSMPTPSTLVYATAAIEVPSNFNVGGRWNLPFSVIVADLLGEKANRFLLPHSASNESRAFPFLSSSALLSPSITAVKSSKSCYQPTVARQRQSEDVTEQQVPQCRPQH